MSAVEDHRDEFPVGMRVLVVDDDIASLKILERSLEWWKYHVTTAKNALTALKLLRENKNKFDMVIIDVQLPDMDGFKLLELVGLEMDLPVIMMSANDYPNMVLKGISHGAVDFLVKPVKLRELQLIWQHVIRKKETNKPGDHDSPKPNSCCGLDSVVTTNSNQNDKPPKKRKDLRSVDDDVVDVKEQNTHDAEDPMSRKKPRLVWTPELHHKFVSAVCQLGVGKAVPKKIVTLMNVENLTKENVASHLQEIFYSLKYRQYMKRLCMESREQPNKVSALSNANTSHIGLRSLNDPKEFSSNGFKYLPIAGMGSRLNTPSVNLHRSTSSGNLQLRQTHNLNTSTNDQVKFQSTAIHYNQNGVQGMSMSVLPNNRGVISPNPNMTNKGKATFGCTPSQVHGISNNTYLVPHHSQLVHNNYYLASAIQSQRTNYYHPAMPHSDNNMTSTPLQGGIVNLSGSSFINHLYHQYGSYNSHMISTNVAETKGNLVYKLPDPSLMSRSLTRKTSLRSHQVYRTNQQESQRPKQ